MVEAILLVQSSAEGINNDLQSVKVDHRKDISNILDRLDRLEAGSRRSIKEKKDDLSIHEESVIEDNVEN